MLYIPEMLYRKQLNVVKAIHGQGSKGYFSLFWRNVENAEEIIDAGFYLGIGGVITYKNAGLAEVLENIDLKYIGFRNRCSLLNTGTF